MASLTRRAGWSRSGYSTAALVMPQPRYCGRCVRLPTRFEEGDDLRARIAGMSIDRFFETPPELPVVLPQIGCGQLVLGREAAVEAGLGDAGAPDDLVDADRADALAVEQVPRHAEDLFGGLRRRRRVEGPLMAGSIFLSVGIRRLA
ncbi:MAG: hypothetical protein QM754_20870 [Tepidisphaeraceae bacterium]